MPISYVLPLRWSSDEGLAELTVYLRWLSQRAQVIVVDASPPALFEAHARAWRASCLHVPVDADLRFANGKVNGVHTGMRRAAHEAVIVADDDVRYDRRSLARMEALLREADLVRPQNYFDPLPWHALWDTARTLINRAFGGDWPGTLGVRRSAFERVGGYDGDVLFENLELLRTIEASGGEVRTALDVLVRRRPPTTETFWGQRVRQAYDEFARPWLLALWLAVPPVVLALATAGVVPLLLLAGATAALAEAGRRRGDGASVFPARAVAFAPAWVLERGICAWIAVASRARGGVRYRGARLARAATPRRRLARPDGLGVTARRARAGAGAPDLG